MKLEYALFPGCVAPIREYGFEVSARKVLESLDVNLATSTDFSCCMPACLVSSADYTTGLALTARNICVADELGLNILTLCASCFGNLSRAKHLLNENPHLKREVNRILALAGGTYSDKPRVEHVVTVLHREIGLQNLQKQVARKLKSVRAAPFYGCHLILPYDYARFDDPEFPQKLDQLIEVTGATSVDYPEKASCCIGCGSFFGGVSEKAAMRLTDIILTSARKNDVDCVITTCPFCLMQLELGQVKIAQAGGRKFDLPVLHYVDLLGLSLGLEPDELGMDLRRVDSSHLLEKVGD